MNADETTPDGGPAESNDPAGDGSTKKKTSRGILLVPYPKFVFMYPTLIVSVIAAIILYFGDFHTIDPETQITQSGPRFTLTLQWDLDGNDHRYWLGGSEHAGGPCRSGHQR